MYEERELILTGGESNNERFTYRLLRPDPLQPGQSYPVILFLHGAGERGNDNIKQLRYFPDQMAEPEMRQGFACFVVAPQCRNDCKWVNSDWRKKQSDPLAPQPSEQLQMAVQALQEVLAEFPVDRSRIYLTGISMGGYGCWELACRHPDWFAAVAPICGGGDEACAKSLVDIPIWAFHGDKDPVVPPVRSRSMIEAIQQAGGQPRYSELKGVGHRSWSFAYSRESGLIPWMFRQQKSHPTHQEANKELVPHTRPEHTGSEHTDPSSKSDCQS